jgi:deoxyribonuclease-4
MHVSIADSIDMASDRANQNGCNTFQVFTRNPRGWGFRNLEKQEISEFTRKNKQYGIDPPIAHMPYLPNLASPNDEIYQKSIDALINDLERCGQLNIPYLVTHLGSHMGMGDDNGHRRIIGACDTALERVNNRVMILLENTAGQKNSLGSRFEDLKHIMIRIKHEERVAICFDTCHAFAAGYDLTDEKHVRKTMDSFDQQIGFGYLKVVHLNDSKGRLGCRLDRHDHIGLGFIGEEGFRAVLHHEILMGLPLILETPIDIRRDNKGNLQRVRELCK